MYVQNLACIPHVNSRLRGCWLRWAGQTVSLVTIAKGMTSPRNNRCALRNTWPAAAAVDTELIRCYGGGANATWISDLLKVVIGNRSVSLLVHNPPISTRSYCHSDINR